MQLTRSPLPVHELRHRPRLFTPLAVLLMGGVIVLLLTLLYPSDTLQRSLLQNQAPDSLTAGYLQAQLRYEPDNAPLRLALARVQIELHETDKARQTLVQLFNTADLDIRAEARWLSYEVDMQAMYSWPLGSKERAEARAELLQRLLHDFRQLDPANPQFHAYTTLAWQLNDAKLARDMYEQVLTSKIRVGSAWLREGARTALGQRDYTLSAQMFFAARWNDTDYNEARSDFLAALTVLQSGNLLDAALEQGEQQLQGFVRDPIVLEKMTRLALAANRPAKAEQFARMMLHLSFWWRSQIRLVSTEGGVLPFNDRLYTLSYDAFLANSNVKDALKVAKLAVQQAPDRLEWRRRLAQVAEWGGEPQLALQQWLYLAQAGQDEVAWQAVLRLAPGLFDDEALWLALRHRLQSKPNDLDLWREEVRLAERLGRPQLALADLAQAMRRQPQEALGVMRAELAERSGDMDAALQAWQELRDRFGPRPDWAVRESGLLFSRGQPDKALAVLRQAREFAGQSDVLFWQVYASLALGYSDADEAREAYRKLRETGQAGNADMRNLVSLLQVKFPLEAAQVAEGNWQRFGEPSDLVQAVSLYTQEGAVGRVRQLLGRLTASQLAVVQQMPSFLAARAGYYERIGQLDAAQRDYEAALVLQPNDSNVRLAYLWLLNNREDGSHIRAWLLQWESASQRDPRFAEALAAAYMVTNNPRRALAYYRSQPDSERSYLWWQNVAEALEQSGNADAAWQARRRAWLQFRRTPAALDITAKQRMLAEIRFTLQFAPGDRSVQALRQLLRLDDGSGKATGIMSARELRAESEAQAARKELILSWLLEQQNFSAARMWLMRNYARTLDRPAYADVLLALGENDQQKLADLLDRAAERMPILSQLEAAEVTGRRTTEQSAGFEAQTTLTHNDEVHEKTADALLEGADHVAAEAGRDKLDALVSYTQGGVARSWVTPHLAAELAMQRESLHISDYTVLPELTSQGRSATAGVHAETSYGNVDVSFVSQRYVHEFNGQKVSWTPRLDYGLEARLSYANNVRATDTAMLRMAGMKDAASAALTWNLSRRLSLTGRLEKARYFSQNNTYMGSGRGTGWALDYHVRQEWPEWNVHLAGQYWNYSIDGNYDCSDAQQLEALFRADPQRYAVLAGNLTEALGGLPVNHLCGAPMQQVNTALAYLPASYRLYDLSIGWNEALLSRYSRAWRPVAVAGISYHSVFGSGWNVSAGTAGPVLGGDKLMLLTNVIKGGSQGEYQRQWLMRYEWYY